MSSIFATTAAWRMRRTESRSRTGANRTPEDGASAYRLDWNGMSVAFTGDGRPNSLTMKYAKGVDLLITEVQVELVAISATVNGVLPVIARNTIDMAHNPGYAAGYLFEKVKPRMAMTTHMSYDGYSNAELLSEIRYHYQGPFHFGAPDMIVVNLTRDKVWVRDGVLPDYPSMSPPKFDIAAMGGMLIPAPAQQACRTFRSSRSVTLRFRRTITTRRATSRN